MRLLVVEDFESLRLAVAESLREDGHSVDECAEGPEALVRLVEGSYDVVVLDIMLPGLDGLDVLARARARGCQTAVLLLTARDGVDDRVAGLDRGADDYLVKPFAMAELLARVRALVRRGYGHPTPHLAIAHLTIDTAAHHVTSGGEPVELTAREYALLEYLALRTGQVVSRTEIWEHLYDEESTTISNVVDVYVGYLRRKLEQGGHPRVIHTRRGEGYVLAEPRS